MKNASGTRDRRYGWSLLSMVALLALAALAAGGYELNWTWTGFQGNTLWDWLQLLLLPLIVAALTIRLSQSRGSDPSQTSPRSQVLP